MNSPRWSLHEFHFNSHKYLNKEIVATQETHRPTSSHNIVLTRHILWLTGHAVHCISQSGHLLFTFLSCQLHYPTEWPQLHVQHTKLGIHFNRRTHQNSKIPLLADPWEVRIKYIVWSSSTPSITCEHYSALRDFPFFSRQPWTRPEADGDNTMSNFPGTHRKVAQSPCGFHHPCDDNWNSDAATATVRGILATASVVTWTCEDHGPPVECRAAVVATQATTRRRRRGTVSSRPLW